MKKITILSAAMALSACGVFAQDRSPIVVIQKSDNLSMATSANGDIVTLEGNVSVSADKLVVTKAEKVVINKGSNTLTVYGPSEFTFSGKLVTLAKTEGANGKLEYKAGEDTAYIK